MATFLDIVLHSNSSCAYKSSHTTSIPVASRPKDSTGHKLHIEILKKKRKGKRDENVREGVGVGREGRERGGRRKRGGGETRNE